MELRIPFTLTFNLRSTKTIGRMDFRQKKEQIQQSKNMNDIGLKHTHMHTHSQKMRRIGVDFQLLNSFGKDRGSRFYTQDSQFS